MYFILNIFYIVAVNMLNPEVFPSTKVTVLATPNLPNVTPKYGEAKRF
jgi:hypothetical protein